MKRLISLCLAMLLALSIAGCSNNSKVDSNNNDQAAVSPTQQAGQQTPAPTKAAANKFPDFDTVDLDGNKVTQDIFKDSKLTLITLWAST